MIVKISKDKHAWDKEDDKLLLVNLPGDWWAEPPGADPRPEFLEEIEEGIVGIL